MEDLPISSEFSSLWQVGGWEPGSSQDVTFPLIPDEDRETNTCMLYERILLEASQSVGSNPKVTRTLCRWHQVGDWEWETQYVCVSHNANGQNIRCWQVLYKTQWKKHGDSNFFLNFSFLWKKLIPLARSCPTKVLQEFSKLWLVIFCMNGYSCLCVTHLHNQVPRYNFEWIIIGAIPHKFNQNRCYSTDIY